MRKTRVKPVIIQGDIALIPLTKGLFAEVDISDLPLVEGVNWFACGTHSHATRSVDQAAGRRVTTQMHRVIINAPPGLVVDHIDGNPLNNRRANLRLATTKQNARNRGPQKNNTTGFKGVVRTPHGRFAAAIRVDQKLLYLGAFPTPEAAHAAYSAAAFKYHGEFARVA